MKRNVSQQATIVALTQTEIMLVIVVVVLVLFFFKSQQLQATAAELEKISGELVEHEQARENSKQASTTALDEEVTQKLVDRMVAEGYVQKRGEASRQLALESVEAVLVLLDEKQELNESVNQALRKANLLSPEGDKAAALQELARAVAISEWERRELEEAINEAVTASGVDGLGTEPRQAVLRLAQTTADLKEVGFIPCWRGPGKPIYYMSFNLTYQPAREVYQISSHADWHTANEVVRTAVNGGLPALAEMPAGELTATELLAYGRKVKAQKEALYGKDCRLATTINQQADGTIVNGLIYDQLGLYPVWR